MKKTFLLLALLSSMVFCQISSSNIGIQFVLPDTVWAAKSQECNIYFHNITLSTNWRDYQYIVTCDSGVQYQNRWAFTPNPAAAFSVPLTIDIYKNSYKIAKLSTVIRCNVANGARKLLLIGDSYTYNSTVTGQSFPEEIYRLTTNRLEAIGTQPGQESIKYVTATDSLTALTANAISIRHVPTSNDTANALYLMKYTSTLTANDTISVWSTARTKYYLNMDSLLSEGLAGYVTKARVSKVVWDSTTSGNYVRCLLDSMLIMSTSRYYYFLWNTSSGRLYYCDTTGSNIDVYKNGSTWTALGAHHKFNYKLSKQFMHEGRGGWTYSNYENSASSPFVYSGNVNVSTYLSNFNLQTPTHAIIELGTNDILLSPASTVVATINTALTYADSLINSLKTANSNIVIGLASLVPPATSQDNFGIGYGASQNMWQYRNNVYLWNNAIKAKYAGTSNVYVIPAYLNIDCVNNMSVQTIRYNARNISTYTTHAGTVHPAYTGYYQIADSYYSWLLGH